MWRSLVITIGITLFLSVFSTAAIINIPADQPTIQDGVNISIEGDTVLVYPGTYVENINFNGHNILLGSQYLITGDTSYISQTIIDGDSSGSVITLENGETASSAIRGFTIQNGQAENGGGIKCLNGSSPEITRNVIKNNGADLKGGGIYCENNSNPNINNNVIDSNFTMGGTYQFDGGGGISCFSSEPSITNNIIRYNRGLSGGGVGCFESDAIISENSVSQNEAFGNVNAGGGGISCWNYSAPTISDNHLFQNYADSGMGGRNSLL